MDSDQFDVEVPDTIPAYITRRHEKVARRVVSRAYRSSTTRGRRDHIATWAWVAAAFALVAGIVALWTVWPSPTTYVVVPAVVLVAGVCGVTIAVLRRTGLDRI